MPAIERIILVDDNDADNEYHQIMIERAGFGGEIVVLENGVDALRYLESTDLDKPTYIFLDINMPMMDGFELAERVAPLLHAKHNIIMVLLTSSSSPYDRERAGRLEVIHGFVTKPLTVVMIKGFLADPFRVGRPS
jgi:CheY-like chemotaxis protein